MSQIDMHHHSEIAIILPRLSVALCILSFIPNALHISGISVAAQEWLPVVQCIAAVLASIAASIAIINSSKRKP